MGILERGTRATAVGAAFGLLALAFAPVLAEPIQFENGAGDVTLDYPDGSAACRAQSAVGEEAFDLGPLIVLDAAGPQDCAGAEQRRRIEMFNAYYDDRTIDDMLRDECATPQPQCPDLPDAPRGFKFRSRAVVSTQGWIDVVVVTKTEDKRPNAPMLTFVLRTDRSHLTVDLSAFKAMLGTIKSAASSR
jgi:hypothetical protein